MKPPGNQHDLRESWLRAAVSLLRPYFTDIGYPLPNNIRAAIAFPSTGRKGKRLAECWHATSSADETFEIFIRADLAEPIEVLGVLVKELVHSALPDGVGHGKEFKTAAHQSRIARADAHRDTWRAVATSSRRNGDCAWSPAPCASAYRSIAADGRCAASCCCVGPAEETAHALAESRVPGGWLRLPGARRGKARPRSRTAALPETWGHAGRATVRGRRARNDRWRERAHAAT